MTTAAQDGERSDVSRRETPVLEARNLSMAYRGRGGELVVLDDVSLQVPARSFTVIVGPSGCGKSTMLHAMGGLLKPTSGQVLHGGRPVLGPDASRAFILQDYVLFPWLTVEQNVRFGLKAKGLPRAEQKDIAAHYLRMVGLDAVPTAYPQELSGGMRQRLAIARALAPDPEVVLMDEPFAALDLLTRQIMQEEIIRIREQSGKTFVLITHSIDEALFLGDRILVMSSKPSRIRETLPVRLPWPRHYGVTDVMPEYVTLKQRIWSHLKDEAEAAFSGGQPSRSAPAPRRAAGMTGVGVAGAGVTGVGVKEGGYP